MQKPDLSLFPSAPGVYFYKDGSGRILYVGKARRLRQRLASYFREASSLSAKTRILLQHAERIDILRTGTEKEALLLEASLIKKHRPRFNIVLRDDKDYQLFRISAGHPFPRVEIVRRAKQGNKEKGARFFGPFSSGLAARETWKLIHKYFPLRRCRDRVFSNRTRPCLYHDMGQCLAPCTLPVLHEEYQSLLLKAEMLLSGKSRELLSRLKKEMENAAHCLRFEQAAILRDQIHAVERTLERQSVVLAKGRNLDIIGVAQMPEGLALGVVFVRDGLLIDGRNFFWPGLAVEDTPELISGFLTQYYLDRNGLGESIPPRIVAPWLPSPTEDCEGLAEDGRRKMPFASLEVALSEIREGPVHITRPNGSDEDNLALMAASNAREALKSANRPPLAELLAKRLHIPTPVRRIEVVDISHTGGYQTRAGMVVFDDERPMPDAYRVYALDVALQEQNAEAGDDCAALAAWATRRAQSKNPWPDLILVDGGRGQLAAVCNAFARAGAEGVCTLASIAKARDEKGNADRRAGNVNDRIFLPGRSNPLNLSPGSPELLFLQHLRDAAHDFALGRHRQARTAASFAGELTRLPGVGHTLARLLFEHFGSLEAIANAGEDDLRQVAGIGKNRARAIAKRVALLMESKKTDTLKTRATRPR